MKGIWLRSFSLLCMLSSCVSVLYACRDKTAHNKAAVPEGSTAAYREPASCEIEDDLTTKKADDSLSGSETVIYAALTVAVSAENDTSALPDTTPAVITTQSEPVEETAYSAAITEQSVDNAAFDIPEAEAVEEPPTGRYGTAGRLVISNVGVDVALDWVNEETWNAQSIVDAPDSAAIFPYRGVLTVIADHWNQGFSIRECEPGDSAVIYQQDGTVEEYVCVRVCRNGHNTVKDLIDEAGIPVEESGDGELVMYTCNGRWQDITITYWQPAEY